MTLLSTARALGSRALNVWLSVQVELHGHYSAQRLVALHAYISHFRLVRLWAVLLLVPWPCLVTIVLLDLIPLADPSLGTDKNLGFWTRSTAFSGILAVACTVMFLRSIPMLRISSLTIAATAVVVAVGSSLSGYGLSLAIGFPLPFSLVLETPAWTILMALCLGSAVSKQLKENATAKALFTEWLDIAGVQNSTLVVYSLYNYAFVSLSGSAAAQTALSVLMQATKMAFKYAVNRKISQYPDIKAEAVILNVEISHALFVTFSMQSATSVVTLVVLVALDLLHGIATYYEVKDVIRVVRSLEREMDELHKADSDVEYALSSVPRDQTTVIDKATAILAKRTPAPAVQFATVGRHSSKEVARRPSNAICKRGVCSSQRKVAMLPVRASADSRRMRVTPHRVFDSMAAIMPSSAHLLISTDAWRQVDRDLATFSREDSNTKANAREKSLAQLEDAYVERVLALLHMTEFAMLTEFVEFAVPMIYGKRRPHSALAMTRASLSVPTRSLAVAYIATLALLPNSVYYSQQAALSAGGSGLHASDSATHSYLVTALARTLTYSLLELLSLFRLDWMLRRRLEFSPATQLVFRLESQWRSVQAALILYVSYIIESTLEHHGECHPRVSEKACVVWWK